MLLGEGERERWEKERRTDREMEMYGGARDRPDRERHTKKEKKDETHTYTNVKRTLNIPNT